MATAHRIGHDTRDEHRVPPVPAELTGRLPGKG